MTENIEKSKNNIGYIISVGCVCLLLGLIVSIQTKEYLGIDRSHAIASRELNELLLILKETKSKNVSLENQLKTLRKQLDDLDKKGIKAGIKSPEFQKIYEAAGLTPIKGKGVVISLNNAPKTDATESYDNLVHSDDLLKIVNDLKAAGAKAISINDQRIVTTSEIVTAGKNIVINQNKILPPYVIKAIGPEDTIISALRMQGGVIEYLEVFGIQISIKADQSVVVPAYTGKL